MKLDDDARHIALEGAFNIRDLGGYRLTKDRGTRGCNKVGGSNPFPPRSNTAIQGLQQAHRIVLQLI